MADTATTSKRVVQKPMDLDVCLQLVPERRAVHCLTCNTIVDDIETLETHINGVSHRRLAHAIEMLPLSVLQTRAASYRLAAPALPSLPPSLQLTDATPSERRRSARSMDDAR